MEGGPRVFLHTGTWSAGVLLQELVLYRDLAPHLHVDCGRVGVLYFLFLLFSSSCRFKKSTDYIRNELFFSKQQKVL